MSYAGRRTEAEFMESATNDLGEENATRINDRCNKFTDPDAARFMAECAWDDFSGWDEEEESEVDYIYRNMDEILDSLVDSFGFTLK